VATLRTLEAAAGSELPGIARFKFHEGKVEEFKRLSAQAIEIVRTQDTGTQRYDIYFNDDQSECIVLERNRTQRRSSSTLRTWRPNGGNSCDGLHLRRTPR
jgi:hypothetical protein